MMNRFRAVAAVLLLTPAASGCGDSPTDGTSSGLAPAEQVQAFLPAVVDAAERIVPGLGDEQVAAAIGPALVGLNEQLLRRDVRAAHNSITAIRTHLARYGTPGRVEDAPDITAIELVLDGVQRLLNNTTL